MAGLLRGLGAGLWGWWGSDPHLGVSGRSPLQGSRGDRVGGGEAGFQPKSRGLAGERLGFKGRGTFPASQNDPGHQIESRAGGDPVTTLLMHARKGVLRHPWGLVRPRVTWCTLASPRRSVEESNVSVMLSAPNPPPESTPFSCHPTSSSENP